MSALLDTYLTESLDLTRYPAGFIRPSTVSTSRVSNALRYFATLSLPEMPSMRLQLSTDRSGEPVDGRIRHSSTGFPGSVVEWEAIAREIVPLVFPDADMDQFFAGMRENYERVARELAEKTGNG
jgi:hypothetical protein